MTTLGRGVGVRGGKGGGWEGGDLCDPHNPEGLDAPNPLSCMVFIVEGGCSMTSAPPLILHFA